MLNDEITQALIVECYRTTRTKTTRDNITRDNGYNRMKKERCRQWKLLYLTTLIYFSFCPTTFAQLSFEKVKFSRIEVSSGLSNSNVTCLLQDSKGFLWVGTEDGLNRYDGYEFKVYRNQPEDSNSLLKNHILYMYEDSHGTLWVSTSSGGLHTYDSKQDRFTRIAAYSFDCEITQITEDSRKNIWIAGIKSEQAIVGQFNKVTRQWKHFIIFPSKNPVAFFLQASENEFWIGVNKTGFFKWNRQSNALEHYLPDKNNPHSIISKNFHKAIKDTRGNIWIATGEGLSKFEIRSQTFTNYTTQTRNNQPALLVNNILNLCQDGEYMWVGTENGGLSRLDTQNEQFTNFLSDKNDPSSLVGNSIWSIYKDRQERIWVGTYSKGLCVIDKLKDKFAELDIPLENDVVNALWQDSKKRFWVGTEDGIAVKDGKQVRYYKHSPQQGSLSNNPILSIFEDSRQRMWFGVWDGGLNRYDDKSDRFVSYLPNEKNPQSLSNANVFSVKELTQTGQLLAGTYNGLNILIDENTGRFEKYRESEFEFNNYIRTVYEDIRGNTWIGTIEELTLYDAKNKKITRFDQGNTTHSIQVSGLSNCITEDHKGRLWVGTSNGLHLLMDKKFGRRYTTKDGLPNNIINGILEDAKGNLWLSTAHGISEFNPERNTFKNYDISDGLLSNEFKPNACFKNNEGQFFFGGKGVNVFYPDSIRTNPHVPPICITDLKLFNQSVRVGDQDGILQQQIGETREISLHHQYNFFTIHYVALNFTASNKNQYAYRLEGFDNEWIYVGSQRSTTFTNLDAGTYIFRVKGSNNDGLWNEKGVSLIIHILPPWWQTWWFRTLAALTVVGVGVGYYKLRVRTIKQQNKRLESLVFEKTKQLQSANEELVVREEEIKIQNEELSSRNDKLIQRQEEIAAQRDLLTNQNQKLNGARKTIENQNKKILRHNKTLDQQVKERTKELVAYNQQLEQFAFIAAHNLRAPVARILGLGQILELSQNNPDEEKMIVSKLIMTTEELDKVVKDISTILEIRKNNMLAITGINLTEEINLIKANLENEITETQAEIREDFSQVNILHTVKPYLDSILMNLLSNAIKYRAANRIPCIRIRTETQEGYVCLMVSDNGLGIDLEHHQKNIFSLYKRFHSHVEGKGMGLYLVKTQVMALGGKIEVESTVNSGTTFKVFLKNNDVSPALEGDGLL